MRRVTPAIILAGIVVLAIYWGLTETWFDHVAATEAPYTPNLANGQMISMPADAPHATPCLASRIA